MLDLNSFIRIYTLDFPAVLFAAENLKKYIEKSVGCRVELAEGDGDYRIELAVDVKRTDIKDDGFEIVNTDGTTVITAKVARGVLYGAYDFLERYFGVRFLAPDCEIVPKHEQVIIPKEKITEAPAFRLRGAYNGANRLNKDYYSKSRNHNQFDIVEEKYGGDCGWERVNGLSWATGHNTLYYVDADIYGKAHPEMFAHNRGGITDICFTNGIDDNGKYDGTEVNCVKIIVEYIKRRIAEDNHIRYFMIGQTDSWGGFENECNCERCRRAREKYKSSGILVRFLNVVADQVQAFVKEKFPEREIYIVGFSYSQTFEAPVVFENGKSVPIDDSVVCRDNVVMWLCQSGGLSWGMNKQYAFSDEKHNPVAAANYKAWRSLCKKTMIWDYCANYSEYLWYFPTLDMTEQGIRAAAQTDCEYYLALFGYADINEWQSLLKGYVASKQMWNPSRSSADLVKEFTDGYYGAGAPYVRKLMKLFDDHFKKTAKKHKEFIFGGTKSDDGLMNGNYYPQELFDEAERLIDEGIKAIRGKEDYKTYKKRLNTVRLTPMRMRLYNYLMYSKDKDGMFAYYRKFKKIAKEGGIANMCEGGKISRIEWQMKEMERLFNHALDAWDIYRYIYDGIVGNYRLPERKD